MKNWWLIVDVGTGAIDGYYRNRSDAEEVFAMRLEEGCASVVLCQVKDRAEGARIGDALFWKNHPKGYAKGGS